MPFAPTTSHLPELLLVDQEEPTRYLAALREHFTVRHEMTVDGAVRQMDRLPPAVLVTDLRLPDGRGSDVCRAAKRLQAPSSVLVTTAVVEDVPDAIDAGCDAVLLKPFAPNLLFTRLGRLLSVRSSELRERSLHQRAKTAHLQQRSDLLMAGTNQHWPNSHCAYCANQGITSFEFTSYRRAWYACLACRKVWLAKRQE